MSEGKANPWWLCVRLIWRPDTLATAAKQIPNRVAYPFATGTFMFIALACGFVLLCFRVESCYTWGEMWHFISTNRAEWGDAGLAVLCVAVTWLVCAATVVWMRRKFITFKAVLLSHTPALIPALVWLVLLAAFTLNNNLALPKYQIGWLKSSLIGAIVSPYGALPIWGTWVWTLARAVNKERRRWCMWGCKACSYDLRGSIPAGATTCPECGAPIDPALRRDPVDLGA